MMDFDNAFYTYYVGSSPIPQLARYFTFCGYTISVSKVTEINIASEKKESVCIIGLCVDSHNEIKSQDIAMYLLKSAEGEFGKIVDASYRLCGQFCILYCCENMLYAFSDATGMLQINYYFGKNETTISSNARLIAENCSAANCVQQGLEIYKRNKGMKIFPADVTLFDEIFVLLPDRYLNLKSRSIGWINYNCRKISKKEAIKQAETNSRNVIGQYLQLHKIACPLTAGLDTRLNLAFILEEQKNVSEIPFYTIDFSESVSDVDIKGASDIAEKLQLAYSVFPLESLSSSTYMEYALVSDYGRAFHEESSYYTRTLNIANTAKRNLEGYAILNGHIIDQVGKAGGGYPMSMLPFIDKARYFCALTQNSVNTTKVFYSKWLSEICNNPKRERLIDRATKDIRCGRWASEAVKVFSLAGVRMLNAYNCAETINCLLRMSRCRRKICQPFHRRIINKNPNIPHIQDVGIFKYIWLSTIRVIKDYILQIYFMIRN